MPHRRTLRAGTAAVLWASPAIGQTAQNAPAEQPMPASPAVGNTGTPGKTGYGTPPQAPSPAAPTGLWQRANLFGDMGGLRPLLEDDGLSLGLSETSEVLGNVTGGLHQGADYEGLTLMSIGLDSEQAFGWAGGTFNVSALQIHGRNLSADNLDSLQTASGIEANRATRLWELWVRQAFLGGKVDLKIGQQSVDQEFLISQGASLFINTSMGWPIVPSADLYAGGGPAYPLSSLGVRLRGQASDHLTVLVGAFDDNPPGGPFANDSQVRGAEQSGAAFNTGTGALFIAEIQYALNSPPSGPPQTGAPPPAQPTTAKLPPGLPGVYKLGFYDDTGAFPDQRFDDQGLSLADPASNRIPRLDAHNWSIYGVADQTIWRPNPDGARSVGVFARLMGAPGSANLVEFGMDSGVTVKAPFPGRDNDSLGLGYGLARISGAASAFNQDTIRFSGSSIPTRSSESFLELTYQAQIVPWWLVQPDLQYVFIPGGGIANPLAPGQRVGNELVLGVRTNLTF